MTLSSNHCDLALSINRTVINMYERIKNKGNNSRREALFVTSETEYLFKGNNSSLTCLTDTGVLATSLIRSGFLETDTEEKL